jgi:TfoX/Sxy family transcriptional regulator of competence genes
VVGGRGYRAVMAYDEALAARIRDHVAGAPVEEKKLFGGLAFLVGGHMAVAASGKGGLMVRVEPSETAALLAEPGTSPMEMGGRGPMDGWLRVSAEAVRDEESLDRWVERGLAYAGSLPPK